MSTILVVGSKSSADLVTKKICEALKASTNIESYGIMVTTIHARTIHVGDGSDRPFIKIEAMQSFIDHKLEDLRALLEKICKQFHYDLRVSALVSVKSYT